MLHDLVGSITPLTKLQTALMVVLSFLVYSSVFSKYDLYFNTEKIFVEGQVMHCLSVGLAVAHQCILRWLVRHRGSRSHHHLVSGWLI